MFNSGTNVASSSPEISVTAATPRERWIRIEDRHGYASSASDRVR